MASQRFLAFVFVLIAEQITGSLSHHAHVASCNAIVGRWTCFTKIVGPSILTTRCGMHRA